MENKGFVVEFCINLSSWDHDYRLNQPNSSCHCSEDRNVNVLKRQDISDANNSNFLSRFQNGSNMQMRLGKENFMEILSGKGIRELRSRFTYFNQASKKTPASLGSGSRPSS